MKFAYTRLVYFDTMYNRDSEFRVHGDITFNDRNEAVFASGGMRYAINISLIKKIELVEEEW